MIDRRRFVLGLAGAIAAVIVPKPVFAVVPVFDAAQYGQLLNQMVKFKMITDSTAKTADQTLQLYNDYAQNHKINLRMVWHDILPVINKIYDNSAAQLGIPIDMREQVKVWMDNFPDWNPNQPYEIMWELANRRAKGSIASVLQIAHDTIPELRNDSLTLKKLTTTQTKSEADQLALIARLSTEQVNQSIETRGLMSATTASQANYYGALIAQNEAIRKAPGTIYLNGILNGIPARLRGV